MSESDLVVAGHVCLDLTPEFNQQQTFEQVFCPGRLSLVGNATVATGGAVANTGLAAHKLGLHTILMGKIGTDIFGGIIHERLSSNGARIAMSISPDVTSSYSFVLNLPGKDRIFLHHSGANDNFYEVDIDAEVVKNSKFFHFGYPPLMRSIYLNQGIELLKIMEKVKKLGVVTSLDMAMPDPSTESGQVDWEGILKSVAPWVDVFLPSYEELYLMLAKDEYLEWRRSGRQQELSENINIEKVREFGRRLQEFGMGIILIKAGKNGIYLRTPTQNRLNSFGRVTLPSGWADKELWADSLKPQVIASSTGAGDCAIAGFLTSLIRGCQPEEAIQLATVAGYQNLRAIDAISGLGTWNDLIKDLYDNQIDYNGLDLNKAHFKQVKKGLWAYKK